MPELHSTGRGGAGNIGKDPVAYTDGSIVREGVAGQAAGPGEYSTGRGGVGNMSGDPANSTQDGRRTDADHVPEPSMREHQEVFHTGVSPSFGYNPLFRRKVSILDTNSVVEARRRRECTQGQIWWAQQTAVGGAYDQIPQWRRRNG